METTINKLYELLLADPNNDKDYTEGNKIGGYLVYGTYSEMKDRLSETFGKKTIPLAKYFGDPIAVWHIDDCTIDFSAERDREIPNNPLCFGYLSVIGSMSNVDKISTRLTNSFPRINDLVKDSVY